MTSIFSATAPCPCGRSSPRGKPFAYADCCGRYIGHLETTPAPNAENLMRSRYSAFVLGQADYLCATWHPSTRPATLALDAEARWLGLEVRGYWPGIGVGADRAEVEFVARYRLGGRAVRLHERSRFVCEAQASPALQRWFYVAGDFCPT